MATTRIWAVRTRLDHMLDYVSNIEKTIALESIIDYTTNERKTLAKEYVSCINRSYHDPYFSMVNTKKQFNDDKQILAFHAYQSFEAGEVDAELAHKVGVEYANKLWGDRFEVVVGTHLNTEHIHNHFLINATSFVDGKRYCNTNKDIHNMRNISDEICRKYNLSVIENPQRGGKSRAQYFHEKTLKEMVRESINFAISVSFTEKQFLNELKLAGYEIKITDKNISVKHPCHNKFIRLKSLGKSYTNERLMERILDLNKEENQTIYSKKCFQIKSYFEKMHKGELGKLQRLFLHYQYVLGIIPKDNRVKPKYSEELQKAIRHIDEISNQTILICKNDIKSIDELQTYVNKIETELDNAIKQRQGYRNQIRRCKYEDAKNLLKDKAKALTPDIRRLQKEIALCQKIESRSLEMNKFLNEIEKDRRTKQHERY